MNNNNKYIISAAAAIVYAGSAFYYPAETFIASTVGWLFIIPAAFIAYMGYGLIKLKTERKNRIVIVPNDAMISLAKREAQLNKEKEMFIQIKK